jgi:hypothetical protein
MVEVRYRDRLGNNLFQYCLGRILAEHFGYALRAGALDGFSRTHDMVTGAEHAWPEQVLEGQRIDLDGALRDTAARKIILNGWFQRQEYFTPHRERIQSWLHMDCMEATPCDDADLVVNVRRTDFIGLGWALPFAWYEGAIETALPRGGRVTIVTDDASDPFFRHFRRWRPRFFRGTPAEQMAYMTAAPRLVMSASTFSWWPAFLGNAESVVCPVPSFGVWAGDGGHEIALTDVPGFTRLTASSPYAPDRLEAAYQRWRSYRARGGDWLNRHLGTHFAVSKF